MPRRLAVLAGRGPLPALVIDAARASGREVFVLGFENETDPALVAGLPHAWVPLGAVGRALRLLHEARTEDVVMIGPVRRPTLAQLQLDARGLRLLARLGPRALGDGALCAAIVEELEREGFGVLGADALVAALLAPRGRLTRAAPDRRAARDIALGIDVATRLGELDVGQAAVVQQGVVLAVEAAEGTDRLLVRCAELERAGPGGVLVKVKKPHQERRADLPTIGPETVRLAAAARLDGIAVHAGQCLIVARAQTVAAADAAGLFLVGIARPDREPVPR